MEIRNRSHRKVKLNHSNAIPRYIIAFDTETTRTPASEDGRRFRHELRLGVAQSARIVNLRPSGLETRPFKTADEFWKLVREKTGPRHTTWIVGHNIMFDLILVGMPELFESGELVIDWPRSKRKKTDIEQDGSNSWTYLVVDEPTTIIAAKYTRTQGRIVFVDTMNWFPVPLNEVGKSLGIPKLDMPDGNQSDVEWFEYCKRDTEITFACFLGLIRWVRENDFGMFRYTAPSQAMAAYRHKYMEHNIYAHDIESIRIAERDAFFGGRSECWRIGEIREFAYKYDLTSFYPSVMIRGQFPCVLDKYEERDYPIELLPQVDWNASLAVVDIDTPEAIFPLRTDRGVVYPKGKFTTVLCGEELGYAMRHKYVKRVGTWAQYRCEPIFNKWVAELWAMRKEYKESGDTLYDMFCKFLLNSLFGKFGQRSQQWQNDRENMANLPWSVWTEMDIVTGKLTEFRSFGWQTQRRCQREEISGTMIAIPAFVTAAGRMRMNRVRQAIGEENIFYQGVDSLIVNRDGRDRMEALGIVAECELGKFKHELTTENVILYGAADYIAGSRIVVAGRPRRPSDAERESDLVRKMDVKAGLFSGRSTNVIPEILTEWKRNGGYWKGTILNDGTVIPLQLG